MARSVMIQGTGSNVGKSLMVAGLCRHYLRMGYRVRPFKPQNMSNNSAVASDGLEIGRAQALQARACGILPSAHMNPVLLKPETDTGAQVIVQGKRLGTYRAKDYSDLKPRLMNAVMESFQLVAREADIVLVEGAGSPAEINLRKGDIANMGFARTANVPVMLVADIERGGVIAQLVGTKAVLDVPDAAMIRGYAINKFRGDAALFADGNSEIETRTGWRGLGVLPWFDEAKSLPAEDSLDLSEVEAKTGDFKIVCLLLSRIANFDDLDPLRLEPSVSLEFLRAGDVLPMDADLVIIPGSKAVRADAEFIRKQGWHTDILAFVRQGGRVLGICGGYQILGESIRDIHGIEGEAGETAGLGLLEVDTTLEREKTVTLTLATHFETGAPIESYEIHVGETVGPGLKTPFANIESVRGPRTEGAVSNNGRVAGTYLHGLFTSDSFRREFLRSLGASVSNLNYENSVESALDNLADHLEAHLKISELNGMMGKVQSF